MKSVNMSSTTTTTGTGHRYETYITENTTQITMLTYAVPLINIWNSGVWAEGSEKVPF